MEAVEERPRPTTARPPETPEAPHSAPQGAAYAPPAPRGPDTLDVVLAAFTALGYALSARALLLLSIIGAFVLAVMAITADRIIPLVTLVAYALLIVIPLCILEYRRRES